MDNPYHHTYMIHPSPIDSGLGRPFLRRKFCLFWISLFIFQIWSLISLSGDRRRVPTNNEVYSLISHQVLDPNKTVLDLVKAILNLCVLGFSFSTHKTQKWRSELAWLKGGYRVSISWASNFHLKFLDFFYNVRGSASPQSQKELEPTSEESRGHDGS